MSDFWEEEIERARQDWKKSCERGDSFKKRNMYLLRLDALLKNQIAAINRLLTKDNKE